VRHEKKRVKKAETGQKRIRKKKGRLKPLTQKNLGFRWKRKEKGQAGSQQASGMNWGKIGGSQSKVRKAAKKS